MNKLLKARWLLLALVVFAVAAAVLGTTRMEQVKEREKLDQDIALNNLKLEGLQIEQSTLKKTQLEDKLGATLRQLEAAKDSLRGTVNSLAVTETILDIGRQTNIQITEIQSPGITQSSLNGIPCSALTVAIRADGSMEDLTIFISKLGEGLNNVITQSGNIHRYENKDGLAWVEIRIVVYAYQG